MTKGKKNVPRETILYDVIVADIFVTHSSKPTECIGVNPNVNYGLGDSDVSVQGHAMSHPGADDGRGRVGVTAEVYKNSLYLLL